MATFQQLEALEPDFVGDLVFQSEATPRSLETTGTVYAEVDPITGGFAAWVGTNDTTVSVPIYNGRGKDLTLDNNGFQLIQHNIPPINFYDHNEIVMKYYQYVSSFARETLNAYRVYCFDHVVRNSGVSMKYALKDGQKIGGPALVVHGDYSLRGGPTRTINFTKPPAPDDSFKDLYGDRPLISTEEMEELKGRRFAIVNLWRSFSDQPCVDMPLTFCDTRTTLKTDYSTVEFRYCDRMIETYLGGHSAGQRWFYYPELLSNEGILIKTYDSQGALFEDYLDYPYRLANAPLVPSTAVLHTAVKDPRLNGKDHAQRESIEVRCIVFY